MATLARLFSGAQRPILDLGCGYGRHLAALRKCRLPVLGIDYSLDLLRQIPKPARKAALQADLRRLPLPDASLAGAYMLFNTFGYFSDGDNEAVLEELARTLAPGAPLVLDLPVRGGMAKAATALPASIRAHGDTAIYENWTVTESGDRLQAQGFWELKPKGATERLRQDWELSLRLYRPSEFRALLKKSGFAGPVEIRPLADFSQLGTQATPPQYPSAIWRTETNMAVMAIR